VREQYETKGGVLYVSSEDDDVIVMFALQGTNPYPIGTIANGVSAPVGMTVDASGTLYVANNFSNTVTEYPKGKTRPSTTISDGISVPGDVAVDSNGTLYVSNNVAGTVVEYQKGQTSPSATISGLGGPLGLALDHHGNLYVADERFNFIGCIWRFKPGSTKGTQLNFAGITYPASVAVDAKDDVYVTVQTYPPVINVYRVGKTSPVRTITQGIVSPYMLALSPKGDLFVADFTAQDAVEYLNGQSAPYRTFSKGVKSPFGVAVLPAGT
jgi:serine/threonine-protein kinase